MNAIMLQLLIIQLMLYYPSSGRLREVKYNRKFQTFSSKSGRGRLREVEFQIYLFDLETFGILDTWLLRRGGGNQKFHCSLSLSGYQFASLLVLVAVFCVMTPL